MIDEFAKKETSEISDANLEKEENIHVAVAVEVENNICSDEVNNAHNEDASL